MLRRLASISPRAVGRPSSFVNFSGILLTFSSDAKPLIERESSSSSSSGDEDDSHINLEKRRNEATQLLRSLNCKLFQDRLKDISESRMHMPHKELIQLAIKHGAAVTKEESYALCQALISTGTVFRYGDTVFLKTDEISELIVSALPETESKYQKRIEQLEAELRPIEELKQAHNKNAEFFSNFVLKFGFVVLVFQLGMFIRLTYWELSWDVMEPISYFVQLMQAIVFYGVYLGIRQNPEFSTISNWMKNRFMTLRNKQAPFDETRYMQLKQELERCRRYLKQYRRLP